MDPLARFTTLVRRPEASIDVAEGALLIAACADPSVVPGRWLAELDALADGIDDLAALRRRLFDELGFEGRPEDLADPRSSLLHEVVRRRRGLPITLSVVLVEVGRRAGVELEAVGMPGYFLVRVAGTDRYVDAAAGGVLLDEAGCEARFRAATGAGPAVEFGPHLLPAVGPRAILARILANLRALYRRRGEPANLEWVLRLRLALPGAGVSTTRELAGTLAAQGRFREGADVLDARAEILGAADDDAPRLRAAALALRARLN